LTAIINHFRRIVDAGWSPLVVSTATLAKAEPVDIEPPKRQEPELRPLYLKPPDKKFNDETVVKNCQYIYDWLLKERLTREVVDRTKHKSLSSYPSARMLIKVAGCGFYSELHFDDKTTKEELIAEVTANVMGACSTFRGGCINWSSSERIFIDKTSPPVFAGQS